MKADIVLIGPVPYGRTMFELQAKIHTADGTERTMKWSTHNNENDAVEYRDQFNSHNGEAKNQ